MYIREREGERKRERETRARERRTASTVSGGISSERETDGQEYRQGNKEGKWKREMERKGEDASARPATAEGSLGQLLVYMRLHAAGVYNGRDEQGRREGEESMCGEHCPISRYRPFFDPLGTRHARFSSLTRATRSFFTRVRERPSYSRAIARSERLII